MRANIWNLVKTGGTAVFTLGANHYLGRLLTKEERENGQREMAEIQDKLNGIQEGVDANSASLKSIHNTLKNAVNNHTENPNAESVRGVVDSIKDVYNYLSGNSRSNFIGDYSLDNYIKFLDNLTILEEHSLLHLIGFVVLILAILNIIGTLFANELIKYFNLEIKYPKLANLFKLRLKFQRYYLIWNFILILWICIIGIILNIVTFIK